MRIGRTIPPAAAPVDFRDLARGIRGAFSQKAVRIFEEELKEYFEVRHCFLVSSGTAALTLILQALKKIHPERTDVIVPAFTCFSVASAVVRAGLTIVPCDLDSRHLDFDFDQLSRYPGKEPPPLCVVAAHLYGAPADMVRLRATVADPSVTIVEDAAQAMGGQWRGRKLGTLGDVGLFSLGRGKMMTTVEGGIIITNREDLGGLLVSAVQELPTYSFGQMLRLFAYGLALAIFLHPANYWLPRALPFLRIGETIFDPTFPMRRMSPFQAAMANGWGDRLEDFRRIRLENARACFARLPGVSPAPKDIPDLVRFPLVVAADRRPEVLRQAELRGLGIVAGYPCSIDRIGGLPGIAGQYPVAGAYAAELVTVPIHPLLSARDRGRIDSFLQQLGPMSPRRAILP
jgi:perosamine synthetase